jgi:hypothetical protein
MVCHEDELWPAEIQLQIDDGLLFYEKKAQLRSKHQIFF